MKVASMTFEYAGLPVLMHGFEGDHISETIRRSGNFYESKMLQHIAGLEPGGTIIDVGANIGNHTVFFGLFTGAEKVIAVEPNELVLPLLDQNIASNLLSQKVTCLPYALGAQTSRAGLVLGKPRNLGQTRLTEGSEVEVKQLDDVVSDEEISVIKVDVEGYELEVLKGATRILKEQQPELFLEASSMRRRKKIDAFLRDYGYRVGAVFNWTPTYQYSKVA